MNPAPIFAGGRLFWFHRSPWPHEPYERLYCGSCRCRVEHVRAGATITIGPHICIAEQPNHERRLATS